MGIVIRQSFYSSISAYIGVGIGYLNAIILMPLFMTPDEIGLMRAVMSIALLLTTFSSFGTGAAIIRYFPLKGSTQEALNQLFTFGLVVVLCAFSLLAIALYAFSNEFFQFFEDKSPEVGEYLMLIAVLVLQMTIFNLLEITARSQKEIVIPNAIRDLVYKILHTALIVLFGYDVFDINEYLFGVAAIYCVLILVLSIFTVVKYQIRLDFRIISKRAEFKTLFNYSSVGILTGLGYLMMVQIDQVMITKLLGLVENGVYTTAVFMTVAVEIPQRFVSQISSTIVSDALANNNRSELKDIYQKASINQLILGSFIYGLILINLEAIYALMPNGHAFKEGWWAFMIIGIVKLMDMTFSVNSEIIAYSKHYKFNLYVMGVLSLGAIILNFLFIPLYGMIGAAIATLISYLIFNLAKYFYIKKEFGITPFSSNSIKAIIISVSLIFLHLKLSINNIYLGIMIKTSLFTAMFAMITYSLRISTLFNFICKEVLNTLNNYRIKF